MHIKAALYILMGCFAGVYVGRTFQPEQIAEIAKWGMGVFAFLWTVLLGFMAKVSDVTDVPGITYEEHRRLDLIVKQKIKRLWQLCQVNVFASVLCLIPIATLKNEHPVNFWYCAIVGGLIGLGGFFVLLYENWLEELREFRSDLKERERLKNAIEATLKAATDTEMQVLAPKGQNLSGFGNVIKPD